MEGASDGPDVPSRWWALGALAVGLLAFGLDMTVLNVARPTLATELRASTSQLQWFSTAYTLVFAAGLLHAGLLGDRFGQKRLLLAALALFGVASVGCAYAGSAEVLIAARALVGVGAAFLVPLSASLLIVLFPPHERGRAIAVWATAMSLGIPLGPVVGGWLLDNFWWGSVFLINVPCVLVAIVGTRCGIVRRTVSMSPRRPALKQVDRLRAQRLRARHGSDAVGGCRIRGTRGPARPRLPAARQEVRPSGTIGT